MADKLMVMFSPHDRDPMTTNKVMMLVVAALMPSMIGSIYFYGHYAVKGYLLTILFCVGFEYLFDKISGRESQIKDNSALLTGFLLAMNMPAGAPWWLMLVGSFVAIIVSKSVYGGLGQNPFNPALVGRVFLLIAWPAEMTAWIVPQTVKNGLVFDAVSTATPLGSMKADLLSQGHVVAGNIAPIMDQLIGNVSGCLGGDSALLVMLGGFMLLQQRVISWHIPVSFIGTVFALTGVYWLIAPDQTINPVLHIVSGGVMLGAFFMATDYVTSPMVKRAQLIFGFGCGLITVIIRLFGSYPEGVGFAILIMNAFVPLLDNYMRPKSFGEASK
ncbi:MAG: RnfABCDGE type electron transport complex subunit D [Deferribacterales bacterium]|jgi:electron transport complex protein RnfD